ncbi:hypothetical protein J1605_006616, partial [Eschrichtius robustus]
PVPTAPQEHTSTVTYFGKDEVKSVEAAVSKDLQEEYNEQEDESNAVHEEETKVDEQGGVEGQTSSVQEEPEATKYELEMKLLSETVSAGIPLNYIFRM